MSDGGTDDTGDAGDDGGERDRAGPLDGVGETRQRAIYVEGLSGGETTMPVEYGALRERAREALPDGVFDGTEGGAGSEDTMVANRRAFDDWRILPKRMRDVAERRLATRALGDRLSAPVGLAPVGIQATYHDDGEMAPARAAAALGLPFCLSTVASTTIEDVAEAAEDAASEADIEEPPLWYQLYWPTDRDLAASFVDRAEAAGYSAIVVTVDVPLLGWRERDLRNAQLPFAEGEGLANYLSDDVFLERVDGDPEENPWSAALAFFDVFTDASLTWEDLRWLDELTDLPIAVKGIMRPDDARRAVEHGADAVWVSNHGGRQIDGELAALDALPAVADVVPADADVLFDSGVRQGSDTFRALALGADAAFLGRPYLYALALAGEDGVDAVLRNHCAELDLTLGLAGECAVTDVDRDAVRRPGPKV